MLDYMNYLKAPENIVLIVAVAIVIIQIVSGLISFKKNVKPEVLSIKKYFARRKVEKQAIRDFPIMLDEVRKTLDDFKSHYSEDNIAMRNEWMSRVNKVIEDNDKALRELNEKIDKNNEDTLSIMMENKKSTIINFASVITDRTTMVTREQFNRVFRIYDEYEKLIEEKGLTNGETDIAMRIIRESYEEHTLHHDFLEDTFGADVK